MQPDTPTPSAEERCEAHPNSFFVTAKSPSYEWRECRRCLEDRLKAKGAGYTIKLFGKPFKRVEASADAIRARSTTEGRHG